MSYKIQSQILICHIKSNPRYRYVIYNLIPDTGMSYKIQSQILVCHGIDNNVWFLPTYKDCNKSQSSINITINIQRFEMIGSFFLYCYLWNFDNYSLSFLFINHKICLIIYRFKVRVMVFNTTFNSISVILGGQFYWWRKPLTYRKSLTNFIT